MARKYLKWGERREVPKPPETPMPTLTRTDATLPLTPLNSFDTPLYPSENEEVKKAREQSRRVMEKRLHER